MVSVDHFISLSNQRTGLVREHPHGPHCSQEIPPLILCLKHKTMKMVSPKSAVQISQRALVCSPSKSHITQLVIVMVHFRWEYW